MRLEKVLSRWRATNRVVSLGWMTTSLYTVEQVELVRRLRQTGISLTAVAEIYNAFDRLDDELHIEFPLPRSNFQHPFDYLVPRNGKEVDAFPVVIQQTSNRTNSSTSASSVESVVPTDRNGSVWQMPYVQSAVLDRLKMKNGNGRNVVSGDGRAVAVDLSIRQDRRQSYPFQLHTAEQQEELEQLKKKDEEEIIKEIREFVSRNQLRQQSIAYMTGISQPYVSKFLNGVAKELSERVRNLMFTWYIVFKNNPEILNDFPTSSYIKSRTMQTKERLQRRERFSFKQQHINVLEHYFKAEPYPNVYMRKEIATACNHELQRYQDGALSAKDLVSEHIVANWFSNRRKEKKRKGGSPVLPRIRRQRTFHGSVASFSSECGQEQQAYPTVVEPIASLPGVTDCLTEVIEPKLDLAAASDHIENDSKLFSVSNNSSGDSESHRVPLMKIELSDESVVDSNMTELDEELAAVSSSVMALVDPYGQSDLNNTNFTKEEVESLVADVHSPCSFP
ncbi:hypothetical protein M513_00239 [Trichuris suis]|uniref:Uncharacterized protein n=1 Tax=Trichuris suis TaxID=68888 RepID=A0A085MPD0_9BILA|nr:hypothetical protein M513_00239 [Trichuris suis]